MSAQGTGAGQSSSAQVTMSNVNYGDNSADRKPSLNQPQSTNAHRDHSASSNPRDNGNLRKQADSSDDHRYAKRGRFDDDDRNARYSFMNHGHGTSARRDDRNSPQEQKPNFWSSRTIPPPRVAPNATSSTHSQAPREYSNVGDSNSARGRLNEGAYEPRRSSPPPRPFDDSSPAKRVAMPIGSRTATHAAPDSRAIRHEEPVASSSSSARSGVPAAQRAGKLLNEPSASVIFMGLPPDMREPDLTDWLANLGTSVESVTVIMNRETGQSKRFGFAKFPSVEHARALVEPNFTNGMIAIEKGVSHTVSINYATRSGGYRQEQGAELRAYDDRRAVDSRYHQPQGSLSYGKTTRVNDGTEDIGTGKVTTILLRKLDALTTEEEIWTALSKVAGKAGEEIQEHGAIVKIMLVKEKATKASCGFAFVKFRSTHIAYMVHSMVSNTQNYPTGFCIRKKPVAVFWASDNSFVPVYARSEWSFRDEKGEMRAYRDETCYVTHWRPRDNESKGTHENGYAAGSSDPSGRRLPASGAATNGRKSSLGPDRGSESTNMERSDSRNTLSSEADVEAFFSELEAELPYELHTSSPPPIPNGGSASSSNDTLTEAPTPDRVAAFAPRSDAVMPFRPKLAGFAFGQAIASAAGSASPWAKNPFADSSLISSGQPKPLGLESQERKEKRSGGDTILAKKMASHLGTWAQKQAELKRADSPNMAPAVTSSRASTSRQTPFSLGPSPVPHSPATSVSTSEAASEQPYAPQQASQSHSISTQARAPIGVEDDGLPYADTVLKQCLLCSRGFDTIEKIEKHNRLSTLHLTNLSNTILLTRAINLKQEYANNRAPASAPVVVQEQPQYVDRAAQRREQFMQPDRPEREVRERKIFEGPPPREESVQPNNDGIKEGNVGRSMLEKMGWNQGAGLGSNNDGRADPIKTNHFAQGAGLGAGKPLIEPGAGGFGPARFSGGYGRDIAKKRYEE